MTKLLPFILLLLLPFLVKSAQWEVVNTNNSGSGSLRAMVDSASGGDTIIFNTSINGDTIILTSGAILLSKNLNFIGNSNRQTIISGNNSSRVFKVSASVNVAIQDLVIVNGYGGLGGGIISYGNLIVKKCFFTKNIADTGLANGGAIGVYTNGSDATLQVDQCEFTDNSGIREAGAIGLVNFSSHLITAHITNSTFSLNTAGNYGGAITSIAQSSGTIADSIFNCTFSGNTSGFQGGAYINYTNGGDVFSYLSHCTFKDNYAPSGASAIVAGQFITLNNTIIDGTSLTSSFVLLKLSPGSITSSGYNLISDTTGSSISVATGDIFGNSSNLVDPRLGNLQDNGGPTQTHVLLCGSPAYNAADPTDTTSSDQRGLARPFGGRNDIGAVESQYNPNSNKSFVVSTSADNGTGSLREAINSACSGDTIKFNSSINGDTILLTSGEILIDKSLVIIGNGTSNTILDGNNSSRIFFIDSLISVQIEELTIRNGNVGSGDGGGLFIKGDVDFRNTDIVDNKANNGGGIINYGTASFTGSKINRNSITNYGGGIYNEGTLTFTNSTIDSNYSSYWGAGFYNHGSLSLINCTINRNSTDYHGGAILNFGTTTVTNSTISGNYATFHCGGLLNFSGLLIVKNSTISSNNCNGNGGGILNYDSANIFHCTVHGNSAEYGGGIYTYSGFTTLHNSIVAGNSALYHGDDGDLFISGIISPSSSYNLIGDSTDFGVPIGNGNQQGSTSNPIDPILGPLSNNGGLTLTHALGCGSPAYNAADPADTTSLDQRGFARPFGGRNDIGAVESQSNPNLSKTLLVTSENDLVTGSLRQVISEACPGDTIMFDVSGDTVQLTDQISIDKDLVINGPGATFLAISSNGGSRLFHILRGKSVEIKKLSLVNGKEAIGGCIHNEGTLDLDKCILRNNESTTGPGQGGAIFSEGPLTITECLADSNKANSGGFLFSTAGFSIDRSAIINNQASNAAAISIQPGVNSDTLFTVINSTLSGNRSLDHSIFLGLPNSQSRRLLIKNCTFSNVYQLNGSGDIKADSAFSKVELDNSIVSALLSANSGKFISNGYNLIGNASGSGINKAVGDTFGTLSNPLLPNLSPLDYSNFTPVHRLICGSPAFNAGNTNLSKDQVGNNRNTFGADDIGAYENQVQVAPGPMTRVVVNASDAGNGSLREVVNNACPGDTIIFNLSTNLITLTTGQIIIDKNLFIYGPGVNPIAISGNNSSRIFTINPNVSLQLKNIKLVKGKVDLANKGGAIQNLGILIMDSVTVEQCRASSQGGGLFNGNSVVLGAGVLFRNDSAVMGGAIYNAGQVTLNPGAAFFNNRAWNGGAIYNDGNALLSAYAIKADSNHATGSGGAIYNEGDMLIDSLTTFSKNLADTAAGAIYSGGSLTVNNSIFSENAASTGGAIFSRTNTLSNLKTVQFQANTATNGGAITNKGYIILEDSCVFFNNQASQNGGAIFSEGPITINQSSLDSNIAGGNGGAISLNLVSSNTINSFNRTTFYQNQADIGGAISQTSSGSGSGVTTIVNSTISTDSAHNLGGGIFLDGGSIFSKHNTIAKNKAAKGAGIYTKSGRYYAFHTLSANKVFSDSSIFLISQGFNLFSDTAGAKITFLSSDLLEDTINITRKINIGKLSYQGGKTKVHTIDCNSLAYNNGSAFTAVSGDQTGNPRVANGFADIGSFEFRPLDIISFSTKKPSCFDRADGNIQLTVKGGVLPYHVIWKDDNNLVISDKSVSSTIITIDSIPQGSYKALIRGADSCNIDSITVGLIAPSPLALNITMDSVTCFGNKNGIINVYPKGGSRPYDISLDTMVRPGVDSSAFSALDTGTYQIHIVDTKGCILDTSKAVYQPDSIRFTVDQENISCFSASDGKLQVNLNSLTGGKSPYSFSWQHGNQSFSTPNLTGLGDTGIYTITVTDTNGCTSMQSYHLTRPSALSANVGSIGHVACFGQNTGEVILNIAGGIKPFQIDTATNINSNSYTFRNLPSDTFNFLIEDSNGCQTQVQAIINQPDSLELEISIFNNRCYRDTTGRIQIVKSIGGVNPYSYLWEKIGTIQTWTTRDISQLDSGLYRLTLTDNNGCVVKDSGIVDDPEALTATLSPSSIDCHGDSTGSINASVVGGTPLNGTYIYDWSNGEDTSEIIRLTAGNYELIVTDSLGCKDTVATLVTENKEIKVFKRIQNLQCNKIPTGVIIIDSIRGGAPYAGSSPYYLIFKNSNTQTVPRADSIPLPGLSAGKYEILVRDVLGCEWVDSLEIAEPPVLNVLTSANNIKCHGDSTGFIVYSINGGKPDQGQYQVTFYDAQDTFYLNNVAANLNDTISMLKKGNYFLQVIDSLQCPNNKNISVTEPALPLFIDSIEVRNLRCYNDSSGFIEIEALDGTPGYKYNWSNGKKTNRIDSLSKGTYTIELTDANGCDTSRTFTVTEPPLLTISHAITNVKCYGDTTGLISVNTSGGTGQHELIWKFSTGVIIKTKIGAVDTLFNKPTGTYFLELNDSKGCGKKDSFLITQPSFPFAPIIGKKDISCFNAKDGQLIFDLFGGTSPYRIQVSDSAGWDTLIWSSKSVIIKNRWDSNFYSTIQDTNGCSISKDTTKINEPQPLLIDTIFSTPKLSNASVSGSIAIKISGGTPDYLYFVKTAGDSASIRLSDKQHVFTGLDPGIYQVLLSDSHECKDTGRAIVGLIVTDVPEKIESGTDPILYQNIPNPATTSTMISYYLPKRMKVSLIVINSMGETMSQPVAGKTLNEGKYEVLLNTQSMAAGTYFYLLQTPEKLLRKKMIIVH